MHRIKRTSPKEISKKSLGALKWPTTPAEVEVAVGPIKDKKKEDRWNAFRNNNLALYRLLLECLYESQYGLCAYCEKKIYLGAHNGLYDREIEHFYPRCEASPGHDCAFCFGNLLLCCKGGTVDPLPKGTSRLLSCGSEKAGRKPSNPDKNAPDKRILCPYDLPPFPLVKMESGAEPDIFKFEADKEACARAGIPDKWVTSTIDFLGLNVRRLAEGRQELYDIIMEEEILPLHKHYPEGSDELAEELLHLAEDHLQPYPELTGGKWHMQLKEFYTTRLLCLMGELPWLDSMAASWL